MRKWGSARRFATAAAAAAAALQQTQGRPIFQGVKRKAAWLFYTAE